MVTRHRVNLSLSQADYARLVDQAGQEGKTPSTFALDVLKAYMLRNRFPAPRNPVQAPRPAHPAAPSLPPSSPSKASPGAVLPAGQSVQAPAKQSALSRQERRALERKMKKARGG